jgi:hypothetical protein
MASFARFENPHAKYVPGILIDCRKLAHEPWLPHQSQVMEGHSVKRVILPGMVVAILGSGFAGASLADAQQLFAFPKKGQSQEQQNKDRYECHTFASQQTGFDPSAPAPQAPAMTNTAPPPRSDAEVKSAGKGSVVGGAAVGAAGGAIIGGVSGGSSRAGKGALIGAGAGALLGAGRRRRKQNEARNAQRAEEQAVNREQQQNQQRQQELQQQQGQKRQNYNRAWTACMEAKNYNVK